jgi:hypothetical protein
MSGLHSNNSMPFGQSGGFANPQRQHQTTVLDHRAMTLSANQSQNQAQVSFNVAAQYQGNRRTMMPPLLSAKPDQSARNGVQSSTSDVESAESIICHRCIAGSHFLAIPR